jgi:ATP-binding cassette subfamily F protein uup
VSPQRSGSDARANRAAGKELARLDRTLERLRQRETRLHADLLDAAADHVRVVELDRELRELLAERAVAEERWLELAELVEQPGGMPGDR